ncbi:hypothetical protein GOODEAATRI_023312, partial [Goodea atripinnis]
VMELCRPSDSRLEHVDFECLFSCLSLRLLLRVFSSLLLERRVIFTANKLSMISLIFPVLSLQYPLRVLPCSCCAALPLRLAAHLHPSAALSHARYRLHPDPFHCRPPVQLFNPAQ